MSTVSKVYTSDGSTRIYSSDFKVLSESHIQVYFGSENEANIVSKSDYDLINDAAVFNIAPADGTVVIVKVGTTPDDLLTSTTNITTVATNIEAINTLEDNLTAINTPALPTSCTGC